MWSACFDLVPCREVADRAPKAAFAAVKDLPKIPEQALQVECAPLRYICSTCPEPSFCSLLEMSSGRNSREVTMPDDTQRRRLTRIPVRLRPHHDKLTDKYAYETPKALFDAWLAQCKEIHEGG